MDRPRAGFSLIELLVVMSVAGILMTIVVARIDTRRFQLDSAAKELRSTLVASRGKALLRQHNFVLTFDQPGDRVYVLDDANNNGVANTGESRVMVQLPEDVEFDRGGAPAINGVTNVISFTQVSGGLPALKFHRNGSASEEGTVYLTSARGAGRTIYPQDARAIMIERSIGRVRCMSYRTNQWKEGC